MGKNPWCSQGRLLSYLGPIKEDDKQISHHKGRNRAGAADEVDAFVNVILIHCRVKVIHRR
jgi:hypothetical protein